LVPAVNKEPEDKVNESDGDDDEDSPILSMKKVKTVAVRPRGETT
jgi:hypothetical protein